MAAVLLLLGGCAGFSSKTLPLRSEYSSGQYVPAEALIDKGIASQAGVEEAVVSRTNGLDPAIDPLKGDTLIYLLNKGIIRFAGQDPVTAVKILRRSRDALDANFQRTTGDYLREAGSLLTDDTILRYHGADYEHILVRTLLTLGDLLSGGGDAYAYAVQIGEMQEEIIGSPLGEIDRDGTKAGYKPREQYRRIGFGAYLQGVIREDALDRDEAARAYRRAVSFSSPPLALYTEALDRVSGRNPAEAGTGALHVFSLDGVSPYMAESRSNVTDTAIRLASLSAFLISRDFAFLGQAPVPVPEARVTDRPAPLTVTSEGAGSPGETVIDLNQVAQEQLAANMPWIMARAVLRRAAKSTLSSTVGRASGRGAGSKELGNAVSLLLNLAGTAVENADTRSWTLLPAAIRATRLSLPAGIHTVKIGSGEVTVRIAAGRNSYAVVINPSPAVRPTILIDRFSRPPANPEKARQ